MNATGRPGHLQGRFYHKESHHRDLEAHQFLFWECEGLPRLCGIDLCGHDLELTLQVSCLAPCSQNSSAEKNRRGSTARIAPYTGLHPDNRSEIQNSTYQESPQEDALKSTHLVARMPNFDKSSGHGWFKKKIIYSP